MTPLKTWKSLLICFVAYANITWGDNGIAVALPATEHDLRNWEGEIYALSAAQTQPWLMLQQQEGLKQSFWILHLNDGLSKHLLSETLTGVEPQDILHAKWSADRVIILTANKAVVFDPSTQKREEFTLPFSASIPFAEWSGRHQRLIWGEEVLPSSGNGAAPHAVQSGLALTDDQAQFVTAGYHDQHIRFWAMPDGKLLRDVDISGWFLSHKISSFAWHDQGLLFSTHRHAIHWLPINGAKKIGSLRPCPQDVRVEAIQTTAVQRAFYRCLGQGGYGLVRYDPQSANISSTVFEQSGGEQISGAYQIKDDILVVSTAGYFALYSLSSGEQWWRYRVGDVREIVFISATRQVVALDMEQRLRVFALPAQ